MQSTRTPQDTPPGRPDALDRALAALHRSIEAAITARRQRDTGTSDDESLTQAIAAVRHAEEHLERASLDFTVPPGPAAPFPRGTETDLDTLAAQAVANDEEGR
jgi:hypothetical protein